LCLSCHKVFYRALSLEIKMFWFTAIAAGILLSPLLLYLPMRGFLSLLPKDQNVEPEIAIILGRGPKNQKDFALAASVIGASNQDLSFFVSGMTDAPEIAHLLVEMGISETQVTGERCSQTTWENGLFSEFILDPEETRNILLITDASHMTRAFLVFRSFGFNVKPYPVVLNKRAYFSLDRIRDMLREYMALISYGLSGRFRSYSAEEKMMFETQASQTIKSWRCQLD
jgi:uncharacterized SAM-binding protein YcdF (DUF218 family)